MDPLMDSRLGGSIDNDANFTADISTQMRIPDRLSFVTPQDGFPIMPTAGASGSSNRDEVVVGMQLPDKIIVAGSEQHIELSGAGAVAEPFSMMGDVSAFQGAEAYGVQAPPSVLRVDAARFLEMEPEEERAETGYGSGRKSKRGQKRKPIEEVIGANQSDSDFFEDESLQQLQLQLSRLQRRVDRLQDDVNFFQQRDRIMLPIIGVYALYKLARFLFQPRG